MLWNDETRAKWPAAVAVAAAVAAAGGLAAWQALAPGRPGEAGTSEASTASALPSEESLGSAAEVPALAEMPATGTAEPEAAELSEPEPGPDEDGPSDGWVPLAERAEGYELLGSLTKADMEGLESALCAWCEQEGVALDAPATIPRFPSWQALSHVVYVGFGDGPTWAECRTVDDRWTVGHLEQEVTGVNDADGAEGNGAPSGQGGPGGEEAEEGTAGDEDAPVPDHEADAEAAPPEA